MLTLKFIISDNGTGNDHRTTLDGAGGKDGVLGEGTPKDGGCCARNLAPAKTISAMMSKCN